MSSSKQTCGCLANTAFSASRRKNISFPLIWSGLPVEAQQLALICHSTDAPLPRGFTHWSVYGIPPTMNSLLKQMAVSLQKV
ncbi:MAG: hypothetical protein KME45_29650 [Stenomitos rutilans HA7619-LM2]|nr:hypothetical protein [Stenomitos rutilans HA7619-LM2]